MGNKKRKPGILDVIIILVVLLVIGGAVYYFMHNNVGGSAESSGQYEITYVVQLKDVNPDIENIAVIGDSVYYTESGAYLGKIEAVERIPYLVDAYQEDTGHMDSKEVEGRYHAQVTISATADISESQTTVNDVPVMVSSELPIRTSTFGGMSYCVELEEPNYD